MTMGEFKSAETKEKLKVVSVWDHKTAAAHGSARIVIPERIISADLRPIIRGEGRPSLQNGGWGQDHSHGHRTYQSRRKVWKKVYCK